MWMGHFTHMRGSCRIFITSRREVTPAVLTPITYYGHSCHTYMSYFTLLRESCRILIASRRAMTPAVLTPVTYMNESCHTHEWVMSYICVSHVTHSLLLDVHPMTPAVPTLVSHMNESCHTSRSSHVTRLFDSRHPCPASRRARSDTRLCNI